MPKKSKQSSSLVTESDKSKKTKELIYRTAIRLFQEVGFEEATMRMIASEAGLALGSAYYYFATKEDIVLYFYEISQEYAKTNNEEFCNSTKDLKLRIRNIILSRIDYFSNYQNLVSVLASRAGDPRHRLSPFSPETAHLREEAIGMIRYAMESSNQKLSKEISVNLPELIWLYQLGIIYFWVFKSELKRERTVQVVDESLDLIFRLIRISNLPLLKSFFSSLFRFIRLVRDGK
ncbi:transcriptional regulator, TetR family [Leptospira ryugenii]|uniref:Transcriptional regulator, TetR family n=1 Tax=Leptospira ryugenii TaxID=1917863 RepID=A0A2P2E0N2_9LEPT|nr:TetR/AcrR family transcriptional regulator [Leptospira ryugenii]GBF50429.1 transcriptional regulator, TetR family [Leptospira ryugenii]